jgi:hypothetical protein
VRDGSGGAEEPKEAGVAPSASLNGKRRSEEAEVLDRAWTKRSGGRNAPRLEGGGGGNHIQSLTHHAYHAAPDGVSTAV